MSEVTIPPSSTATRKLYIESYGCAMNFSDSEIIASIMGEHGFASTTDELDADVIFLNTCAIRDNAEQRIRERLKHLRGNKKHNKELIVGVLGCMAERLKEKLLEEEKLVDVVAGPDSYRDLPKLVAEVDEGGRAINVLLSREETYGDLSPVRLNSNGVTAFVSIMRGCDNMCSFCVVPFTRGRERSRDPQSIVKEVLDLSAAGYKEITLLGQNVNSYLWFGGGPKKEFKKLTQEEQETSVDFADLLQLCAEAVPHMRIRYSTSHPRDINEKVVYTMAKYKNLCNYIHLPAQSGNTRVLDIMSRNYSRDWYMDKIRMIRSIIPDCGISCDIIAGFCSETEDEHQDTLSLIDWAEFEFSYMYVYSERPGTPAAKKLVDDVPEAVKSRRLSEIIALQNAKSKAKNESYIGKVVTVLVEGPSKKSDLDWMGRSDQNSVTIFPCEHYKKGDLVNVLVERATTTAMIGKALGYASLVD
ncbi:MAG: tRNA (N6-isopentenyl adenosine(37)-C2)-methylthiotransferase MiaB [Bacteroidetes bacterium]|nr:tRNA (N6-isopentenyl adenosine(37)-C2)-methylthiotransferase MiaB [Bacteroidota bacterium]